MAQRLKTIEYAFASSGSAVSTASSVATVFSAITVYIPESASRTFRSVILQMGCRDGQATACTIGSRNLAISVNSAAVSGCSITDTYNNSGEHQSWMWTRDVTGHFTTNFTGASNTVSACLTVGNCVTVNHTAKLIITYEYDDTSASTRVKTVKIPIESAASTLTNATCAFPLTSVFQIPVLDTFLPETSKTYRDIFFEVMANEGQTATTTYQMALALDNEADDNDATHQAALNSSTWMYYIWKRASMTTSASHQFKARGNNLTARFPNMGAVLNVTYEYDHSTTASVINSLWMPFIEGNSQLGGTTAASQNRHHVDFYIEEPDTITLRQSGLILSVNENATMGVSVAVSGSNTTGQTTRLYTINPGTLTCGGNTFIHRFDSSASGGSSLTLSRGKNTIEVDMFSNTASVRAAGLSGLMLLNYTSGLSASGDGVHNRTTIWTIQDMTGGSAIRHETSAIAPVIPETNYWINNTGYHAIVMTRAASSMDTGLAARLLTGEEEGDGWDVLGENGYRSDDENSLYWNWFHTDHEFRRHPGDTDSDRMELETARPYAFWASQGVRVSVQKYLTYHAITYAVSGSISSGSQNVTVNLVHAPSGERVASALTANSGSFSLPWYDDTQGVFVEAMQSATLVGRSASGLAAS